MRARGEDPGATTVTGAPAAVARGLAYLRAAHAAPTVAVTAFAVAVAAGAGAPGRTVVLVGAAVLTGQLSVGWCNDWVDAARDVAAGRPDKPVVRGELRPGQLRRAAFVAAAACAVLSFAVGVLPGALHVVAVASAWAYDLGLKSTVWSWAPYVVSFGLLPAFVVTALPGAPGPAAWLVVATALLGLGAHLVNVAPDIEDDLRTGVRGLPHRLGRRGSAALAPAVLVGAAVVVAAGSGVLDAAPAWVAATLAGVAVALAGAAGATALRSPASRAPFALAIACAATCVVGLVAAGRDALVA